MLLQAAGYKQIPSYCLSAISLAVLIWYTCNLQHEKPYLLIYALSDNLDQPEHLCSLISHPSLPEEVLILRSQTSKDSHQFAIGLDKSGYQVNIFVISPQKHILSVLINSASSMHF